MKRVNYYTPGELKQLMEKSAKESSRLPDRLKKIKPARLDEVVHSLHEEAFARFSCLDCANCCSTIGPRLTAPDIERLARFMKMKTSAFHEKYVITDEDGDFIFSDKPCPFLLQNNYCSVYEQRPKACREYPHTDRKRFYQILGLSMRNCETCPVVYAIFEELKEIK
jgi:uncharacterized protein